MLLFLQQNKCFMECRANCAACCIIPSISSPSPKHPDGKQPGERCQHLTNDLKCELFDSLQRPKVCGGFKAEPLVCGTTREEAFQILAQLEGIDNWTEFL
jgi:Fe-S-cluster containining protein